MIIDFCVYMFKERSHGLLNNIFEKSMFCDQSALIIVFWVCMLKEEPYVLLNNICEKSRFDDQMMISSKNQQKWFFCDSKLEQNQDFRYSTSSIIVFWLYICLIFKHHVWEFHFWWPYPHFKFNNQQNNRFFWILIQRI